MYKAILLAAFCCVLVAAAPADEKPDPYAFQYESTDADGNTQSRSEQGDANGAVSGQYSYKDASGITRTVTYTADDQNGFQAQIQSNEPGLISSAPAAATYNVQ